MDCINNSVFLLNELSAWKDMNPVDVITSMWSYFNNLTGFAFNLWMTHSRLVFKKQEIHRAQLSLKKQKLYSTARLKVAMFSQGRQWLLKWIKLPKLSVFAARLGNDLNSIALRTWQQGEFYCLSYMTARWTLSVKEGEVDQARNHVPITFSPTLPQQLSPYQFQPSWAIA